MATTFNPDQIGGHSGQKPLRMNASAIKWSIAVFLAAVLLVSCSPAPLRLADTNWQLYRMRDTLRSEQSVETIIEPYRTVLAAEMEEVIGQASVSMTRGQPESTLGNFMADLMMAMSPAYFDEPADLAVHNPGGLRIPEISAGAVRVSDVYQLMPFDNTLVMMTMRGNELVPLFERMAASGGWPLSKEVSFQIRDGKPENVVVSGEPLELERVYRVVMPDYVANGGSNCDFLRGLPYKDSGVFTRDVIIEYIRAEQAAGRSLSAEIDGRVLREGDRSDH